MPTKKTIKRSEIQQDPLWQYSGYELLNLPAEKIRKLLYGADGKTPRPHMIQAFEKKVREFKNS